MIINRYVFFIFSLLISLTSCVLMVFSIDQMTANPDYVALKMAGFDGPGIQTIMGAFLLSAMFAFFHIVFHIVFIIGCLTSLKGNKINIMDVKIQKDKPILNYVRTFGFVCIAAFLYIFSQDFIFTKDFFNTYTYYTIFGLTTILAILCYVIWITSLLKKRRIKEN